jgi:serine protease Do
MIFMKKLVLFFLLFPLICSAQGLSQEQTFNLNRHIVKVHAANQAGNHGVGSGVVIAKDHVVTNCHVIANANGIHVTKYGTSYPPQELIADWYHDICILSFKYLDLDPVQLGSSDDVDYATDVVAKSYGGNATRPVTSVGKVRDIFDLNGKKIIQSSTWFSLGASGGGLFDSEGRLLGITTFKTPGHGALYYSIPVEVVKDLLEKGQRVNVTTQAVAPFWDEPPEQLPFFMRIVKPLFDENWSELNKLSQEWLSKDNALEANYYLAKSFYHLNQKDEAKKLLMKVIDQKSKHSMAHQLLSKIYQDEGNQVESEYHANLFMELDSEIQEFNKN